MVRMRITTRGETRGTRVVRWVEQFCRMPAGPDKGKAVVLTPSQREAVAAIYDGEHGPVSMPVDKPLSAYLALIHVVGPEAVEEDFTPEARG